MSDIPKVFFQTNKTKHPKYVLSMIAKRLSPGWRYEFYDDAAVIQFFTDNPLPGLDNIITIYNSFEKGAHRADIFRYYYLYVKGGFFIDSDAMIYENIDNIIQSNSFVSVDSSVIPGSIFQGILGASPKNEIIKTALYDACNTNPDVVKKFYHHFCKRLYQIIKTNNSGYKIKLLKECRPNRNGVDNILDGNKIVFKHYWKHKVIPRPVSKLRVNLFKPPSFKKIYFT